jgi:CubicO group peptidase (beta-lactamase class C family)
MPLMQAAILSFFLAGCMAPTGSTSSQSATLTATGREKLNALVERAKATHSDALVVMKGGKLLNALNAGDLQPVEAMSITKSLVSLAIGRLVDGGKLSLDTPVSHYFPEWQQGLKDSITLKHILSHTSGIQYSETEESSRVYPDYVQRALAAELSARPGETFVYNNKAVNVLSELIARVSGRRMDEFIQDELLEPLGITSVTWKRDKVGSPLVMAGLAIHPGDLAKVGQLLLDGGVVNGQRLLSRSWIDKMTQPSQDLNFNYGLLWWIVGPDADRASGYAAMGSLGQYLVVIPSHQIVAVRMRHAIPLEWSFPSLTADRQFADFPEMVASVGD